jgi:hypothetical protein
MPARRRLVLLGVPAAVVAVALVVWLLLPRGTAITRGNAAKIQPGMTRAEVEALLGGPAGDYTAGRYAAAPEPVAVGGPSFSEWLGEECSVMVSFDEEDRVVRSQVRPVVNLDTLGNRLHRWFGG